jgi:hypothetical protein
MPPRWAGIAKYKLDTIDNGLACTNMLGPKPYTELSGSQKDTTTCHNKKEREKKIKQVTTFIFNKVNVIIII